MIFFFTILEEIRTLIFITMNDKEFYESLKKVITEPGKYQGSSITKLCLLKIIYFDSTTFNEIKKLIDARDFVSLLNYNSETDKPLDQIELITVSDKYNNCFITVLIDPVDLWSDKYLYESIRLSEGDYLKLTASNIGKWNW
jgi:hypothetical protein